MNRNKIIFALAVALLVGVAGLYFSGYVTQMLLKQNHGSVTWKTYPGYMEVIHLPQWKPYVGKIKAGGFIGFGLPAAAYLALLILMLKPRQKTLHGDARFANSGDLSKHGMLKPSATGVIVGKFNGDLVRLPGQQFVILAAPTRSGKGVGVVIPNLLDYQESMVVLDIKQENYELTSGWRKSQGQEVYLFNPFAEDRKSHRWNPLTYVSRDPAFRVSDLMSIAAMLYPDGSDDQKFWVSQARNAFMAFALYLFENWEDEQSIGFPISNPPTLGAIYRLSSGDGTELRPYLQKLSQKPFLGSSARNAFA
ncbi:MAG: type IV secretory system conjugative DNA transfer family protein, partial [Arenimonas sp.]